MMSKQKAPSVINLTLPQDIADELQYFVDKYDGVTKKHYVSEAIRNYNMLQRMIEKFKKEHPDTRYEIKIRINAIDDDSGDDGLKKAAILVY